MSDPHPEDPVEVLRRWEDTGAIWHVVGHHGDAVTIGLFSCDGGEEVSRFTACDPDLRRFLADRDMQAAKAASPRAPEPARPRHRTTRGSENSL